MLRFTDEALKQRGECMQFLLLICHDNSFQPPAHIEGDTQAWIDDMEGRSWRRIGGRLRPPAEATTVRVRDGASQVTAGPYAQTAEFIAGFDVIECPTIDDAISAVEAHPMAQAGTIEIRPLWTDT
jgi:hypothetical protein